MNIIISISYASILLILYICLDETLSSRIFKNQVTTLFIIINNNDDYDESMS